MNEIEYLRSKIIKKYIKNKNKLYSTKHVVFRVNSQLLRGSGLQFWGALGQSKCGGQ
jgi:hypothetical protein